MRCPYCGRKNPNNAKKCAHCGRRLDRVRVRRKERSILIIGILLIAVILAAGVGAMFGISHVLERQVTADEAPQKVTILSTPTPTPTAEPEPGTTEEEQAPEAEETPAVVEPTPVPLTGTIADASEKDAIEPQGYYQVTVANATATSVIEQENIDNEPHVLYDGAYWSSWQDGVEGDGLGESITFTFDQPYKIRYMVLRLGNWYDSDNYYYRNNRPQTMTFELDDQKFEMTFPDSRTEFVVRLSEEVTASTLKMTIDSVYKGTEYEDTCINEVDVFGKAATE